MNEYLTEENIAATLEQLILAVENYELMGTSVTNSFGEIEIKGVNYQLQMRLEKDENMFITPDAVTQSTSILRKTNQ